MRRNSLRIDRSGPAPSRYDRSQASRTIASAVVLVGLCLAQQESVTPSFNTQTDLVIVPFQVRRGSRSVSDLKPADVVLLEDGVPRNFTTFEAPSDHPSLELVVMFDLTDIGGGFWDPKYLRDLTGHWNEATAGAILEQPGATVRVSLYHFDRTRLQRLCRSTADRQELLDALRRLPDPISDSQVLPLELPPHDIVPDSNRDRLDPALAAATVVGILPKPWSLLGAITALRDSAKIPAAVSGTAARVLVVFSQGEDATSTTPRDLADMAVASDVLVYPVALAPATVVYAGGQQIYSGQPFNQTFESLGELTGGREFDAGGSISFGKVREVLEAVKAHALARIGSHYIVGFAPSASGSPREHKLEVKLALKSSGKVAEGKRTATY
jgi:VWFA-related protein